MIKIGAVIKSERLKKHWRLEDLAKKAGVAINTVKRAERGLPVRDLSLAKINDAITGRKA